MLTVVTGANGHVGANLVRALLAEGRAVRVLVHEHDEALRGLQVEVVRGDVRDPVSLQRAFAGAEVVYHLAAIISIETGSWPALEPINVVGVHNMVQAALAAHVRRLVHFSSIHALEQTPFEQPVDENNPFVNARHAPYDRSKAAGEREVRRGIEQGLNAVIIAPTGIIGPYDYQPSHAGQMLLSLAERRMPALVNGGFDWVDVRDVVAGAMLAEQKAPAGAKYLLSGHWASLHDVAEQVEA
ncbi:MAG TPA: NAD-dependent epimerase/dehydratase family protein, partial [bacterium]|nr:NAD-dependent epimerase/dehydratase family protein [bacterium]